MTTMTVTIEEFEALEKENEKLKLTTLEQAYTIKEWEERWEKMQDYNLKKAVEYESLRRASKEVGEELENVIAKLKAKNLI